MNGAFLTQVGQNADHFRGVEIGELEALVSGVAQTSQSTLLLKKKKEMREVDDSLDFMKHQFKSRMETCEENQRKFEAKQQDLKENVLKFEKFIQENDAKRQRAEVKFKTEARTRTQKEADLRKLSSELEEKEAEKAHLLNKLRRLRCYREYLESIVDQGPDRRSEFEEVEDLLNRYQTLERANYDLVTLVDKGTKDMDELRKKLQELRLGTQNSALVGNSDIHRRQMELEEIRAHVKRATDFHESGAKRHNDETREMGQVIMGIRNVYNRCSSTSRVKIKLETKEGENSKLDGCLKFICEKIVDLSEIVTGYNDEELQKRDDGGVNRILAQKGLAGGSNISPGASSSVANLASLSNVLKNGSKSQVSSLFKPSETILEEPSKLSKK